MGPYVEYVLRAVATSPHLLFLHYATADDLVHHNSVVAVDMASP